MENDVELEKLRMQKEILDKQKKIEDAKVPNSSENINKRVDQGIGGWVLIIGEGAFVFIIFAFGLLSEGGIGGFIICGIIGFILLKLCFKTKNKKEKYMDYISLITITGERSIVNIANEMNVSYEEAYRNLIHIISHNYIKGFKIDKSNKLLVETSNKNNFVNNDTNNKKCKFCGANLFVQKEDGWYCKHCGSKI